VGQVKPGRAVVVEPGQRAGFLVAGVCPGKPSVTLGDEFPRGVGDRRATRIGGRFLSRRPGHRERLKAGRRRVAETAFLLPELRSLVQCPKGMQLGMKDAEEVVVVTREDKDLLIAEGFWRDPDENPVLGDFRSGENARLAV